MTPERWQQVKAVFQQALERDTDERTAFLAQACADDDVLHSEVTLLLDGYAQAGSFIETPAHEVAADFIAAQTSLVGQQLSHYKILAPLGKGGMGEVYRARDSKLQREVAIKVLPADFSSDRDRVRRFEREARAASALNHPNILTVHEIGDEGRYFLVTELIEGQTLRQRLADGRMELNEVLEVVTQVAAALAAAHAAGIVHRDIKPENVMLRPDGLVKVLDFGLAKLKPPQSSPAVDTQAPTLKLLTGPGVVLGTVGYMAPEQVRGEQADHRTDIFAFGVMLYEMLAGRPAFQGNSAIETLNAILKEEPPELSETNAKVGPQLGKIVRRCLEKQPERRFQTASDLGFALEVLSTSSGARMAPAAALPAETENAGRRGLFGNARLTWLVAAVLLITLMTTLPLIVAYFRRTPARQNVTRSAILPPEGANFLPFSEMAISPDGRRLAFVARGADGKQLLWVRLLDTLSAQPLAGTDGANFPFWSPDSRFIGFFAAGKLKKIDAAGGPPQTLCDAPNNRGATWSREGVIVFAPRSISPLHRVSAAGGVPSPVTKFDTLRRESHHRWPYFLPDGRHFLYLARGPESKGIYLGSLDSDERRLLLSADTNAAYASGHLLFWREGTLMAQPFEADKLQLGGEAFPIAEQVQFNAAYRKVIFSVSDNGVLVYQIGKARGPAQLLWFDRDGKPADQVSGPDIGNHPRLSPDGQRLAVSILDPQAGTTDIWLHELARNVRTRFTFDPAYEISAIWSPDGSRLVFQSSRKGHDDLYQKAVSGAGSEEVLLESDTDKYPTSWSSDGRFIAYTNVAKANTKADIWILPLAGERKPFAFLQTPFNETDARFSPDGRWIAYVSDESGSSQIYIAPFPQPDGKRLVSSDGGTEPRWRGDGKELFFLAADGKLMAVEVKAKGATLMTGTARPLFEARKTDAPGNHYDVTANGQRFLVNVAAAESNSGPLTLVVNWTAEVKR